MAVSPFLCGTTFVTWGTPGAAWGGGWGPTPAVPMGETCVGATVLAEARAGVGKCGKLLSERN